MNKIKIILVCLVISFLVLIALNLLKLKNNEEFRQKAVLAHEIRKVLDHLIFDLLEARENSILDVPADGLWHHRIAFVSVRQGALEYILKEGRLFRVNRGGCVLIADDIGDLLFRRQKGRPDILEVQIVAQKNVSLISNLRIRVLRH